ncbi:PorT family protein [Brumimicrobium glaciale]|uniref:PorT family protein n=1 Tax=Brumimicrobium glaciale TaxID=200475 RepID=A0A4Q4KKR8_9FLAO|nr:outer membrane beta-barrel protein [Brumimicrobium glaciale]RYM33941.1 PorT family protein [Brumimicrobium glaciale]
MIRFSLILVLFIYSSSLSAQYEVENEGLYSRFRPGIGWFYSGLKPFEEGKLHKYDRLILDVVYNDWYGDKDYFASPPTSIGFNAALMFDVVLTKGNTMSFGWGVGYSHYSNKSNLQFFRDLVNKTTLTSDFPVGLEPKSSKFGANYIEIPLELRFRTKGHSHFKFMIGGKIGYQLNAYSKETNRVDGKNYSTKQYNFADSNPLRYGATVRIGIRNWAIYGAYYFSPLFTDSGSADLTPISMGVSISLF